jgi:azurin
MGSLGDPTSLAIAPAVFIEGLHVFVDASYVANPSARCIADTTALPAEEDGPGQIAQ